MVLSMGCWLEFEIWVLHSKINARFQSFLRRAGQKSVVSPEDRDMTF